MSDTLVFFTTYYFDISGKAFFRFPFTVQLLDEVDAVGRGLEGGSVAVGVFFDYDSHAIHLLFGHSAAGTKNSHGLRVITNPDFLFGGGNLRDPSPKIQ